MLSDRENHATGPLERPAVTAVILAHNGVQLTLDCIASLRNALWPRLRVILIDNASSDGTADVVTRRSPDTDVLRSETNLGYAGGSNRGFSRALEQRCDYVLLLNNDTIVEPSAVAALVAAAMAHPNAGAIAPLVTYANPDNLIWYGGADYDARRGYAGRVRHYRQRLDAASLAAGPTDRFTGAAVLLPRTVLEEVEGFDEGLFFLYEDVDLSLRIRTTGRCVWFAPEAVIRHRVAMAQGGEHSAQSFYYGVRNQLAVAARHAPLGPIAHRWRTAVTIAVHLARLRRAPNPRAALGAIIEGARDNRRKRVGPRP